jgi:hypothetical protein
MKTPEHTPDPVSSAQPGRELAGVRVQNRYTSGRWHVVVGRVLGGGVLLWSGAVLSLAVDPALVVWWAVGVLLGACARVWGR